MGEKYRQEKRTRRLAHIKALFLACEHCKVDLSQSYCDDLTIDRALQYGQKRLGAFREDIVDEANRQGIGYEALYKVARQYSAIPPSPGPHPASRIYLWRNEQKLKPTKQPVGPILSMSVTAPSVARTSGANLVANTEMRRNDVAPREAGAATGDSVSDDSPISTWSDAFLEEPSEVVVTSIDKLRKRMPRPSSMRPSTLQLPNTASQPRLTG
jgi:hypothetical protein